MFAVSSKRALISTSASTALPASAAAMSASTMGPVSYTHLDVYKRQWLQSCPHYYGPAHVGPLATRLMTEFPSTTTDPELLAAIGKDLLAAGHGPRGIVTPTTRYAVRPPAAGTRGRALALSLIHI